MMKKIRRDYWMPIGIWLVVIELMTTLLTVPATSSPLNRQFDFTRGAIGLDVTVKGAPILVILDTGVDPSVINILSARALGLKIDTTEGGEASGYGNGQAPRVFPTHITDLAIGGRPFAPIDALATDTNGISTTYGRKLDGVLGFSFLKDKVILIDYAQHTLGILDQPSDATSTIRNCRQQWHIALQQMDGDSIPIVPDFRFGGARGIISLDTGSNGGIALFPKALDLPGLRAALVEKGEVTHTGALGGAKSKTYALSEPVGFGPFTLPAGAIVKLSSTPGTTDTRVANIGNGLFAAMGLKILLNYRDRNLAFYGQCERL